MLDIKQRNGRLDIKIHMTEVDPALWRQMEKLLRKHSVNKKQRRLLAATRAELLEAKPDEV